MRFSSISLLTCLLLTGCAKAPRNPPQIPDPVGQANKVIASDGTSYVLREIMGGPSGSIDATSHPFEIELVPTAVAKYLRSPVSYAAEPAEGQLVVYGPKGASDQAVMASGMSADAVGIANGILIPVKVAAPSGAVRTILGWTGDAYAAAGAKVYVTWGSGGIAGPSNRVFAMPLAGRLTRLVVATRGPQPTTGALEFRIAKAGVAAQGLQVTIASGAAAGVYASDGGVDVAVNDLVQIEVINRGASNSAYFNSITAVFEY